MGICGASDFSSTVSKDTSGKSFHKQLSLEIEDFLNTALNKFGGVLGLVDLYCLYNRARGTDMISPEDLLIAVNQLNETSTKYMIRNYTSGLKTVQSRLFKEDQYYEMIAGKLQQEGCLSTMKLAEAMKVNVALMKEHVAIAEERGFVCKDESYEGVQWYENRIKVYGC